MRVSTEQLYLSALLDKRTAKQKESWRQSEFRRETIWIYEGQGAQTVFPWQYPTWNGDISREPEIHSLW